MAGEMYRCTQHQTLKLRATEKLGVSNQCIGKAFKGSLRAFGFWMLLSRGMESKNEKKSKCSYRADTNRWVLNSEAAIQQPFETLTLSEVFFTMSYFLLSASKSRKTIKTFTSGSK